MTLRKTAGRSKWRRGGIGAGMAILLGAGIVAVVPLSAGAATSQGAHGATSGSVAAISRATMEVQSASAGQTAVDWTASTTFSQIVNETASSVTVGDCVTVTGTPSKKSKTKLTARSVSISQPSSSGKCTTGSSGADGAGGTSGAPGGSGGFRRGSGGPPAGFGGGGSGGKPSAGSGIAIASGKVTDVKGTSVSLSGTLFDLGTAPKSGAKKSTTKTQKLKITTAKSTTYSTAQTASSSALAVGDCVSAIGQTGSTGDVTATTVSITSTGGQTCSAGFGGGGLGAG
jgi:Domain of unknown function (DUF5666)